MGHILQVECCLKHPIGYHFQYIMAKEIGKGKEAFIGICL